MKRRRRNHYRYGLVEPFKKERSTKWQFLRFHIRTQTNRLLMYSSVAERAIESDNDDTSE
jgi:hypothetical protein